MPRYEITSPDGKRFEVNAPDGASEADVMAYAQQQFAQQPKQWQPTKRTPEMLAHQAAEYRDRNPVTNDANSVQNFAAGVGKSLTDTGQGLSQLFGFSDQADVDQKRATDDALMNTKAGIGGNIAGLTAQAFTPGANAAKLVSYGGKGATFLKGAAQAAPLAFVQPVASGESRAQNTAINSGLGGAGAKIAPALQAAGSKAANAIPKEVRAVYEMAKARGISLTPAQISDSRFMKFLSSQMQSLPGSGAAGKTAEQRAVFNRELAKTIGEDADVVTPEVYAAAKARHSAQFEALTERNDLRVTPQLMSKLEAAIKDAELAGGDALSATRAAVDEFYSRAVTGPNGITVPGRSYQALDSALGQVTKQGTPASHYVGQVKGAVRDAMDSSISPADKAAWAKLRTEYGNRKTLRDLVAKSGGGSISPSQLQGRVTANNYGKEAMATGNRGELGDLARIGQAMKEPPDSGTASRLIAGQSLNPLAWPIMAGRVLGGATAGRAANSDWLAQLMMREGRGSVLNGLARLAETSQPQRFLPAAGIARTNSQQAKD